MVVPTTSSKQQQQQQPPLPPGARVSGFSSLQWIGRLDLYRKVPTDLLEGTRRGSILSYCAVFIMVSLFLLETKAFFEKKYVCFFVVVVISVCYFFVIVLFFSNVHSFFNFV